MPYIPDLTQGCKTDHDLRPYCKGLVPKRKQGSDEIRWTTVLEWELSEVVDRLQLPPKFRRDTTDLRVAYREEKGTAFTRKIMPRAEIVVDLDSHVGTEILGQIAGAKAVLESFELRASKGKAKARAILTIVTGEQAAEAMVSLLACDVRVRVHGTEPLFVAEEDDADEMDDGGETDMGSTETGNTDLPPEPAPRQGRQRKASLLTDDATV